ncbi:MAG: hypothetical protein AAGC57_06260 [Pseudomonadota bacterium]
MRPASIRTFEVLILLSLALGLAVTAMTWSSLTQEVGQGLVIAVQAATLSVVLWGVFLVARRANNLARWVFTVMFGIGFIAYIPQVAFLFSAQPTVGLLGTIQVMLQLSALMMLFRADARVWFRARRKAEAPKAREDQPA